MLLEAAARDIKCLSQDEPDVLLWTIAGHGNFVPTHFDVDSDAEIVAPLVMAMRDVGHYMAGNDSRAERIQLDRAFTNFGFDGRIGFFARERDVDRLPHA
jgi:hypothetical protein